MKGLTLPDVRAGGGETPRRLIERTLNRLDPLLSRPAAALDADKMSKLGIANTRRIARAYNGLRNGSRQAWRRSLAQQESWPEPIVRLEDGFAIDESGALPGLDELLAAADEVIEERGGTPAVDDRYRAFFRNLLEVEDHVRWPQFIDFATSPELISVAADYLGFVPALTRTLPTGVRLVESGRHLDALAHLPPRDSQVFHIDPYDSPLLYVIVLVRDTTAEMGPFTFIPASTSERAKRQLSYWSRGKGYRLSDEEVYSVVDREETISFTYPRGTVLFVDTSRCLHYGARDGRQPRFQCMLGFSSVCRTDFSETHMPLFSYPEPQDADRLRRIITDRTAIGI